MKRNIVQNNVEVNGDFGESGEFQVARSAEMFRLISDSLYSRPIEAIIRELSCNAADSHAEAGNESAPFDVKLPNRINDQFYIRDYGTGLTPEEIRKIYTVVFESNKTHSNDFTGCFGVGSKSPFSYTDKFLVESFKDGKKWIYAIYFNEDNIPSYTNMGEQETEEPNGIKVSFNVKRQDQHSFSSAASKVLRYFDPLPNIIGDSVTIKKPTVKFEAEDGSWRILERGNGERKAIMGNVSYDIDPNEVDLRGLRNFEIEFELGELEPAASREYLQYGDKTNTKESIQEKVDEIVESLKDEFDKKIDSASSYHEACALFQKHHGLISRYVNIKPSDIEWEGKKLTSTNFFKPNVDKSWQVSGDDCSLYRFTNNSKSEYRYYDRFHLWNVGASWNGSKITIPENIIIYADKSYGKYARVFDYIERNNCVPSNVSLFDGNIKDLKKLLEKLGKDEDDYVKVSEIDPLQKKVKKTSSGPTKKAKLDVLELSSNRKRRLRENWTTADPQTIEDEKCYYVVVSRFKWAFDDSNKCEKDPKELIDLINEFKIKGIELHKVIGVKKRSIKEAKKNPNWKPLEGDLKNFINYLVKYNDTIASKYDYIISLKNILSETIFDKLRRFEADKIFDDKIKNILVKYNQSKSYGDILVSINDVIKKVEECNIEFDEEYKKSYGYHYSPSSSDKEIKEINDFKTYLNASYPMLDEYSYNSSWKQTRSKVVQTKMFRDYINSKYYYDKAIKNKSVDNKTGAAKAS